MKTPHILLLSFLSMITFSQCKSKAYKLQKKASFSVKDAFYQDWTGERSRNSGTVLQFNVINVEEIVPDSIYFNNRVEKVAIKLAKEGALWVVNYRKVVKKDINIQENPFGEYGNSVPEMENFPFKLANDEAVLKYTKNTKVYYLLITGIRQKQPIFFPSVKSCN